jgi:hypothetical protein
MMAGVPQRYFISTRDVRMWDNFLALAFMNVTLKRQKGFASSTVFNGFTRQRARKLFTATLVRRHVYQHSTLLKWLPRLATRPQDTQRP